MLPIGEAPNDVRFEPLKSTRNGYFPFDPPATRQQWADRSEWVRRRVLVATGLWPMPEKTPLNAVIHGRIERDGYTIEKVFFESRPGFYVTGNLYRPASGPATRPGVLCPYGHWPQGRFMDQAGEAIHPQILQGAERFESNARNTIHARCVQLARMGCVVFCYDMIGYADSVQIPYDVAHFCTDPRDEMNTLTDWGLYSAQAEAHLQNVMGLQTWNSIRSLDFLLSLPDVDAERIGVTGASSGATQTFILAAVDPRPSVIFAASMVGTAMQGGCTCENASLLRIDTGNVEIAGLFAPKPLGLTSANDWTVEMSTKGYPELRQLYRLLDAPENISLTALTHFGHNYNYVSRGAMYQWFNKHLVLGLPEPVLEAEVVPLTAEQASVWDAEHPAPAGGPDFERRLLREWTEDTNRQVREARNSVETYRTLVGGALEIMIGRTMADVGEVTFAPTATVEMEGLRQELGLLRNVTHGEEIPVVLLRPAQSSGRTVLWIDKQGKAGLCDDEGAIKDDLRRMVEAGTEVVGIDLFMQGEFLADGQPVMKVRRVENDYPFAGFTYGYNHTLFAQRVHDILSTITYLRQHLPQDGSLALFGLDGSGHWAGIAAALARESLDRAVIDTGGFRFGKLLDVYGVDFLPGGAKYGDLPGLLALAAPLPLELSGEDANSVVRDIYQKADAADHLTVLTSANSNP